MAKNKFADLPPEFVDAVDNMKEEDVRKRICQITMDQFEVDSARRNDDKLSAAKNEAKELGAPYRDASKMNKLKIKYLRKNLLDSGKIATQYDEESP